MARRATVTEVAHRAGVSVASVSRVLNGIPARADTEQRVRQAAQELGYVPDAAARSLKLGRSLQIAFAVDDIANPVYAQMLHGMEAGLLGSGSQLLVSSTGRRPDDLLELVHSLSRGLADGLVISPLRHSPELIDALAHVPVPVVVIGDIGDDDRLDQVRTDSAHGVALAYDHLIASGRSRVAFVNGPSDTTPGRVRLAGFEAARARHAGRGPVVEIADFTVRAGESAWTQLSCPTRKPRVDAVIAANDLLALGIARAALKAGRRIPQSLAVVGIDDIEMTSIFTPTLTTVSLGAEERGRIAAQLMLRRMGDPSAPPERRFVAPRLLERESTRPVAPRGRR